MSVSRRSSVASDVEDRLHARAHDRDRRLAERGQVGRLVPAVARLAVHAAEPAGGEHADPGAHGERGGGGDGGRAGRAAGPSRPPGRGRCTWRRPRRPRSSRAPSRRARCAPSRRRSRSWPAPRPPRARRPRSRARSRGSSAAAARGRSGCSRAPRPGGPRRARRIPRVCNACGRHRTVIGTMLFSSRKTQLIDAEHALPGRDTPMPVPARHEVLGTPIAPPFPEGLERMVVGMGCFWGAERIFWQAEGVYTTAVGYAGGFTPNPSYEEVCSAGTGHAEVVLVVFDPTVTSYEAMLRLFWEGHDPTQGMRQGNDVGTQYRSGLYWTTETQRTAALASRDDLPAAADGRGPRRDLDRDRRGGAVLLRRGVPPAVPRQEPERVLRDRRHRRQLPDRPARVAFASMAVRALVFDVFGTLVDWRSGSRRRSARARCRAIRRSSPTPGGSGTGRSSPRSTRARGRGATSTICTS